MKNRADAVAVTLLISAGNAADAVAASLLKLDGRGGGFLAKTRWTRLRLSYKKGSSDWMSLFCMLTILLEFCIVWSTWERNHVADVLHTCYEEDETLESETEATVRTATETTGVEIPFHILHRDVA